MNRIDPLVEIGRQRLMLIVEAIALHAEWHLARNSISCHADLEYLDALAEDIEAKARVIAYGDEYCSYDMPTQFLARPMLKSAWEDGMDEAKRGIYRLQAAYWDGYEARGRKDRPPVDCIAPIVWLRGAETMRKMMVSDQMNALTKVPTHAGSNALPDEQGWRAVCERAAAEAHRGCGLSHDYYVTLFSGAVEDALDRMPEQYREAAIAIAREWDYATPDEREQSDVDSDKWCSHGIELGCCPAGCGSY